ncbi:MAG: chromate transporter [Acidobacteria bacterium]|nr:MAG: chromate transporter [Acidobacteriota bacterium]
MGFLDLYLVKKAPFQIPDAGKEWIVKFGPWITVVLLILTLPILLFALGIGTIFMPFGGVGYASGFGILTLFVIVEIGLMIAALPGLFNRKMAGWRLLFYSQLVSIVYSVLSGSVVGGLVFGLIALYILFQVRPLYRE